MDREVQTQKSSVIGLVRLGLAAMLLISIALILSSLWLFQQVENHRIWTDHTYQVQALLAKIERDILTSESSQRAFVFAGSEEFLVGFQQANTLHQTLGELQKKVSDNPPQVERGARLQQLFDKKLAFMNRVISLKRAGDEKQLRGLILGGDGLEAGQDIRTTLDEMYNEENRLMATRQNSLASAQLWLNRTLIGGLLVLLVLGPSIMAFLVRRLSPLGSCAVFAERIGRGDLTPRPLRIEAHDEVGRVSLHLNQMLANLRQFARQGQTSADSLNLATAQIAAATKEQAVALQQQSTAMQQTSVTLEELAQSAAQIAEKSRDIASRAEETSQAATRGEEAVQKTVRSTQALVEQVQIVSQRIDVLSEKTQAIRDIVLSVNDIAERSNVLVLNASILAAASGVDGKSFTVVANEMKSLADQSKEATVMVRSLLGEVEKGIQASVALIEEAVKRGASGAVYTDEASTSIERLSGQVAEGTQAFQQIVAATNQQRLAFEQVAEALASIRQATQQSAATTQQLEQASRDLHGLSGDLVRSLDNYQLDKSEGG